MFVLDTSLNIIYPNLWPLLKRGKISTNVHFHPWSFSSNASQDGEKRKEEWQALHPPCCREDRKEITLLPRTQKRKLSSSLWHSPASDGCWRENPGSHPRFGQTRTRPLSASPHYGRQRAEKPFNSNWGFGRGGGGDTCEAVPIGQLGFYFCLWKEMERIWR